VSKFNANSKTMREVKCKFYYFENVMKTLLIKWSFRVAKLTNTFNFVTTHKL